jgi:hypothetical protein
MRPGKVVNIRVNPTDCLGILDVARKVGVDCANSSFPQIVSLALSTLLQSARNAQQIPTRMGYEFEEEMAPYLVDDKTRRKVKLQRANEIHLAGSDFQMPGIEQFTSSLAAQPKMTTFKFAEPADPSTITEIGYTHVHTLIPAETPRAASGTTAPVMTKSDAAARLTVLLQKKDMAEDNKAVWTARDDVEYKQCYDVVYPEG